VDDEFVPLVLQGADTRRGKEPWQWLIVPLLCKSLDRKTAKSKAMQESSGEKLSQRLPR